MSTYRMVFIALLGCTSAAPRVRADDQERETVYRSPYSVKFTVPVGELCGDLDGPRGDPRQQSEVPYRQWSSGQVRKSYGSWGPPQRHYPEPPILADKSVEWKQQRVIAVALHFQGYDYQHHHVPDWAPPAGWPWKKTCAGHNSKGVDCSNFTAFVYNLGFGIKPNSNVHKQAEERAFALPGEDRKHAVRHVPKPKTYKQLVDTLQTGDLLFIRNKDDEISHVVLWVGSIGHAPDEMPLIIDSHGDGVKDSEGIRIPCGIHLRPFREDSWYYRSASHALRVFHDK